jgi:hypothetical protein
MEQIVKFVCLLNLVKSFVEVEKVEPQQTTEKPVLTGSVP